MSTETSSAEPVAPAAPAIAESKSASTDKIIRNNVIWSMGAALVPIPIVDIAAVAATQLKLISELAKHYGTPFSDERARGVIASLIGSVAGLNLGRGIVASLAKSIPVVGTIGGMIAAPTTAGATTYAIGRVFDAHFASGGTLLTFEVAKMREFFQQELKAGEEVAASLKDKAISAVKK